MVPPAGSHYRYGYDGAGNLASVSYPDATPADPTDNPTRIYHYEDSRFPHALTGITDEKGNRYATWAYDAQGRAILSEHAGGAGRVALIYNTDGSTTVTDALGASRTYTFQTLHGVVKPVEFSGDRCGTCAGQAQAYTYDANGFSVRNVRF